jgi:hypothetical protein
MPACAGPWRAGPGGASCGRGWGGASAVKQAVFTQAAAPAPACVGRKAQEIQATLYEGLRQMFEQFDREHIERIILEACEAAERPKRRQKRPAANQ